MVLNNTRHHFLNQISPNLSSLFGFRSIPVLLPSTISVLFQVSPDFHLPASTPEWHSSLQLCRNRAKEAVSKEKGI